MSLPARKPDWLRIRLPVGPQQEQFQALKQAFKQRDLNTVCEEARCPNIFECWGQGTATIMILGDTCTRGCRFCSVKTGDPNGGVDPREPENTARALSGLQLAYVVLTMVDRDDLLDGGSAHVAQTVQRIKHHSPDLLVETLVGDFQGRRRDVEALVTQGKPDVYAHNVEVVPRLQRPIRDARCSWEQSLNTLRWAKKSGAKMTKSSLMVGIGEQEHEVLEAMHAMHESGVDVITIGQYLRPTKKHAPVQRYVTPEEFESYRTAGEAMGFRFVASGPLVRSSYRAAEAFLHSTLTDEHYVHPTSDTPHRPNINRYGKKIQLNVIE